MTHYASQPPRPKPSTRRPSYPRTAACAALGFALATVACGAAPAMHVSEPWNPPPSEAPVEGATGQSSSPPLVIAVPPGPQDPPTVATEEESTTEESETEPPPPPIEPEPIQPPDPHPAGGLAPPFH